MLEIPIDRAEARVGSGHFIFDERPHALPFAALAPVFLRRSPKGVEQLADLRRFQRESGTDQRQRHRLAAKDRSGAERPDDFIVPQINHPDVRAGFLAVAGQGQDDVRIDAGHGGVHHFEFLVGMAQLKHGLQHAGQPETRLRIAKSGGSAKDKNPNRVGRFLARDGSRDRLAGRARAEKSPAKLVVLHEGRFRRGWMISAERRLGIQNRPAGDPSPADPGKAAALRSRQSAGNTTVSAWTPARQVSLENFALASAGS